MGRLSAQCTDKRVNIVCRELFEKYPTASTLAEAELSDVEAIIRPCGLFHSKAESIIAASRRLVNDYGGILPNDMSELLGINQTTISHQLKQLKDQGIVSYRREGKILIYSLVNDNVNDMMMYALNVI